MLRRRRGYKVAKVAERFVAFVNTRCGVITPIAWRKAYVKKRNFPQTRALRIIKRYDDGIVRGSYHVSDALQFVLLSRYTDEDGNSPFMKYTTDCLETTTSNWLSWRIGPAFGEKPEKESGFVSAHALRSSFNPFTLYLATLLFYTFVLKCRYIFAFIIG